MEQKFIKLEEAVDRLGVSSGRLNQLREQGEIRAYRDGSSWKFRTDEIEKLLADGLPEVSPPSDIGLVVDDDLVAAEPLDSADFDGADSAEGDELALDAGDLDLSSGSDLTLNSSSLGLTDSDVEGGNLDDTVPADGVTTGEGDLVLEDLGQAETDRRGLGSDSILLSEEQLGESAAGSPSTIIGKSELEDADLEMATEESALTDAGHGLGSDVRLASDENASHVLSSAESDSDDVLGDDRRGNDENESKAVGAFEDLDELEIDLAVESSRILNPDDVTQAKAAAQQDSSASKGAHPKGSAQKVDSDLQLDDLELAVSDSHTGDSHTGDSHTGDSSAGDSSTEGGGAGSSDIELSSSDSDFVLAESGSSDLSLEAADSGINLVDPSDSGLALDNIPLEMGGSAILDSLSLGGEGSDSELSLVGGDSNTAAGDSFAELQTDDDFQLTPMGEGEADADESSSQVIALDEGLDTLGGADFADDELGDEDLLEDSGEAMVLTEEEEVTGFESQPVSTSTAASAEDYTVGNILLMGSCVLLLMIGSTMMIDMVRSIWSWDQPYALNSTILDGLMGIFKLK